jgi:hypothetical protein
MVIVKGFLQLSGNLKNVSFYTRRGNDQVIARTKGGATKEKIATSSSYKKLRQHQNEWKGCAKFGSVTRYAFGGLHRLADYNLTPVLMGMAKNLMKLEPETETGQRKIQLSQHKQVLEGFNFNRKNLFTSELHVSVTGQIDRENLLGTVNIPRINAVNDLVNYQRLPYFRLITVIGTVADMYYDDKEKTYFPTILKLHGVTSILTGSWFPSKTIVPEQTMTVQMTPAQQAMLNDTITVVLSVGVEYGTVGTTGETVEVKYAGCGKVLGVI